LDNPERRDEVGLVIDFVEQLENNGYLGAR